MAITLQVDEGIVLEQLDYQHAERLHQLVKNNRNYLRTWLPWVDHMRTVEDFRKYIENARQRYLAKLEIGFVIVVNHELAGRIGLNHMDGWNRSAAIGYWLDEALQGKGIITKCCETIIQYAFSDVDLNRIEIRCGTGNDRSRAIIERLGCKHEGIARQAEFVNNRFIDLHIFSILKHEYTPNR